MDVSIRKILKDQLTDCLQFDSMGPPDAFEPDSEDEDESLTVPKPLEDDLVSAYLCLIF